MRPGASVAPGRSMSSRFRPAMAGLVCVLAAVPSGCGDAEPQSTDTSAPAITLPTVATSSVSTTAAPPSGIPLVVDTDLAVDSVMALLYLLGRPEVNIAAVTVSGTGEVHCGPGAEIAAGLIALVGASGIPVACGPSEPLAGSNAFPADWRSAADDAWGLDLPVGEAPSELPAGDLLVSIVSSSDEPVVVFTDGPLTNLAAAMRQDPGIVEGIAMVFVMGGAVDVPGNTPVNPDAEYNIWVDPTAAAEVFASGAPVTLLPLDATNQVPLESRHLRALEEHAAAPAAAAVLTMLDPGEEWDLFFWDGLAAATLVDESLAGFETMTLGVVTDGGPDSAGVTRWAADGSEIRVAMTVDAARFEREFLSSLAGVDVGPIAMPPRRPAASVGELLTSLLAAASAGSSEAWASLCTDEAMQSTYLATEGTGRLMEPSPMAEWDPGADPVGVEILGEPLVVGDAGAIPVRHSLQEEPGPPGEGFVVIVGDRAADGLLVAGSARFLGVNAPPVDAAVAQELIEAQAAAWNADDVDGVLATMTADVVLWGDVAYPEDMTGSGPALGEMIAGAFWMHMDATGPPVTSGPFAAVPLRFTDETSAAGRGVIAILWIRDGRIALMALAQGELQGESTG